jgi:hypothetical protein
LVTPFKKLVLEQDVLVERSLSSMIGPWFSLLLRVC